MRSKDVCGKLSHSLAKKLSILRSSLPGVESRRRKVSLPKTVERLYCTLVSSIAPATKIGGEELHRGRYFLLSDKIVHRCSNSSWLNSTWRRSGSVQSN